MDTRFSQMEVSQGQRKKAFQKKGIMGKIPGERTE